MTRAGRREVACDVLEAAPGGRLACFLTLATSCPTTVRFCSTLCLIAPPGGRDSRGEHMGNASLIDDREKRRQEADSGIEEFWARSSAVAAGCDTDAPLDWRWELVLGGEVITRITDLLKPDGWFICGALFGDSSKFERFRLYFKKAHTGRWSKKTLDAPALELLCDEVRARGEFELHDRKTGAVWRDFRFQVFEENATRVKFRPRPHSNGRPKRSDPR